MLAARRLAAGLLLPLPHTPGCASTLHKPPHSSRAAGGHAPPTGLCTRGDPKV